MRSSAASSLASFSPGHLNAVVYPASPPDVELAPSTRSDFALSPAAWYFLGTLAELRRAPVRFELPPRQSFVGFCTNEGMPVVLSARCAHMGADLARGCVSGGSIACPLHGWEYAANGRCVRIPAGEAIPSFARVPSFPVEVQGGHVFFFNRAEARFPLPFFAGVGPDQLYPATRFEFVVDAPWYVVSANGFDLQHFRCAHDRTLVGEPIVDSPHPFAWRMRAQFRVSGASFADRLVRWFSGSEVEMEVTNWCGNLVLVSARFARTTSYGTVSFVPLDAERTLVRDIVWVPRSANLLARRIVDPVDARVRRHFIREFVRSDVERSAGIRFDPRRMIAGDKTLVDYLAWLHPLHR